VTHIPQGADIALTHQASMYGASAIESCTAGLGMAAFLAFLMAIADKSRSVMEYAIPLLFFACSRLIAD